MGKYHANWHLEAKSHPFKNRWDSIEHEETRPRRLRNVVEIDYLELREKTVTLDPTFVESVVTNLYAGDVYIVHRAFDQDYIRELVKNNWALWQSIPPSFNKMLDDCPDFHTVIDEEASKNYYGGPVKHSYYFYPWNKDPLNLYAPIRERWRIFKFLGGMEPLQYESNIPSNGVCDRIQFAHYPSGAGKIEIHEDPYKHVKPIISVFMSKRGVDFEKGGVFFVDRKNVNINLEHMIDIGDAALAYPTVAHGVEKVDPHLKPDWNSPKGRWWLGMFSNASDTVKDRHTWRKVEIEKPV